jgi:hypothetical protein
VKLLDHVKAILDEETQYNWTQLLPQGILFEKDLMTETGILLSDGWYVPAGGTLHTQEQTITIAGMIAAKNTTKLYQEDWKLSLDGRTMTWTIQRKYISDISCILADRFPGIVLASINQIPSFLDIGAILNGTRGFVDHGDTGVKWYSVLSHNTKQMVQLSPSGNALEVSISDGSFFYSKTTTDGTSKYTALGAQSFKRDESYCFAVKRGHVSTKLRNETEQKIYQSSN